MRNNYPNLVELFRHFDVETQSGDMSFGVSLDQGRLEYSSTFPRGLFGQPGNMLKPGFWAMLRDIARFYRSTLEELAAGKSGWPDLGQYLERAGYSPGFAQNHSVAHGRCDLVRSGGGHGKPPGRILRPVLRKPQTARSGQSPTLAHRTRGQPRLCGKTDCVLPGSHLGPTGRSPGSDARGTRSPFSTHMDRTMNSIMS